MNRSRAIAAARRAWVWVLRVLASWVMLTHWLPRPLLQVYLEWQQESLAPDHPAMSEVLTELAEVRECAGTDHDGPGLLISPAFWLGGVLALLAWTGLYFGLRAALT